MQLAEASFDAWGQVIVGMMMSIENKETVIESTVYPGATEAAIMLAVPHKEFIEMGVDKI